jgi:hypothetical protein
MAGISSAGSSGGGVGALIHTAGRYVVQRMARERPRLWLGLESMMLLELVAAMSF